MFNKRFFWTSRGGATMLLLWIFISLNSSAAKAQDMCNSINCTTGQLFLEVVKVAPGNVTPECPQSASCGNGDAFHQIFYKVYLRYTRPIPSPNPPGNPPNFLLDYSQLKMTIGLVNNLIPPSLPIYSRINKNVTQACYLSGPGANWDPMKVIFKVDEVLQTVAIDFMNTSTEPCGTAGEKILLTYGIPAGGTPCPIGSQCFNTELFTVVVNAFPREGINLVPYSPIFQSFSGISCTVGNVGFNPLTVAQPITFDNTLNQSLLLKVADPVLAANGIDQDFNVEVINNGPQHTINYLEFLVKATSDQSPPLNFSGLNIPRVVTIGNDRFLHYTVTIPGGHILIQNQKYSVGTIVVSPPNPVNQSWGITLDLAANLTANGYVSRVKTNAACTSLPFSNVPVPYTHSGEGACTNLGNVFVIRPKNDFCSPTPTIQAGIKINLSGILNFTRFVFEIEFELNGGLYITGANFDDWAVTPSWDCPTPVNSCLSANPDAPCYDIIGDNIIRFCFSALSANPRQIIDEAFVNIEFNSLPYCVSKATVRYLELVGTGVISCVPPIENELSGGNSDCPPQLRGQITTELGNVRPVEAVTITISTDISQEGGCNNSQDCQNAPCAEQEMLSDENGNHGFCVCDVCNCFIITPEKDDNHLNGVTTYDLVLISKHILGIEQFISPYKMIAADANKSNSITTFDIVTLRKLILGLISTLLPNNTSWRFADKSNPPTLANPFGTIKEDIQHFNVTGNTTADFIGIKIGDVNNTVVSNRPSERPLVTLSWPVARTKTEGVMTIPITYSGSDPLDAIQLGLRYDPAVLQLISPSQGDLPSWDAGSFNLTQQGEIKTLWLSLDLDNPNQTITQGTVLFYLTFKLIGNIPESGLPIWMDNSVLDNAAWRPYGTECALMQSTSSISERNTTNDPGFAATCSPNPSTGELTFSINADKAGKGRIALFSPYGVRLLFRDVEFVTGVQQISLPEAIHLPVGVYTWRISNKASREQGHWVKQ